MPGFSDLACAIIHSHSEPSSSVWDTLIQLATDVNTPKELIPVNDAVAEYSISRSTIFRLFKEGLARYRRPGDRKTYVSRAQLEDMISFRKVE